MYDIKPNLILGFHGCDRSVRDKLLINPDHYKISQKSFDWLGHGLYFWENNYDRALQAVIELLHDATLDQVRSEIAAKGYSSHKIFDSTRGAFIEGGPAFEGAEIREKTHIQICIRNPNCIR